jgi:hypothetical protein
MYHPAFGTDIARQVSNDRIAAAQRSRQARELRQAERAATREPRTRRSWGVGRLAFR